jgi:hypothetical protein
MPFIKLSIAYADELDKGKVIKLICNINRLQITSLPYSNKIELIRRSFFGTNVCYMEELIWILPTGHPSCQEQGMHILRGFSMGNIKVRNILICHLL